MGHKWERSFGRKTTQESTYLYLCRPSIGFLSLFMFAQSSSTFVLISLPRFGKLEKDAMLSQATLLRILSWQRRFRT